jgi:hypothetical protein
MLIKKLIDQRFPGDQKGFSVISIEASSFNYDGHIKVYNSAK